MDLNKEIRDYSNYVLLNKAKKESLEERISELEKDIKAKEEYLDLINKTQILLKNTSEYARKQAISQIEIVVTRFLQYVFETDIEFRIELQEKSGVPSCEFYVVNTYDGIEIKTKPEDSRGGGVVDIVSMALRISFITQMKKRSAGPLILDEPGKHVSSDYIFNLGEFLRELSKSLDMQIIMVTHNEYLKEISDNSQTVNIKNGISEISLNKGILDKK